LMHEYRGLSGNISYERIDPQVKPNIANQYGVKHMDEIIVASDKRTEHPERSDEQTITDAILKVTRDTVKNVCFVEGHGEKSITSTDRDGYQTIDKGLKSQNYETKSINLVSSKEVPSDCAVLVLAGPTKPLLPPEAAAIGKYLEGGGKAMLLLDPDTDPNLNDVLGAWGVEIGDDTVVDASGIGQLVGTGPLVPVVATYGSHAITKGFERTMTAFPLARSVSASSSGGSETDLLKTSPQSWAAKNLKDIKGEEISYRPGTDKKGPINLGVVINKTFGDKEARLVVIGDSDFATNQFMKYLPTNGDLFLNAVSWLAQDEDLISIRPKSPTDRRVTMTASQQNMLFWLTILFLPGAAIGSGVYIWVKRR